MAHEINEERELKIIGGVTVGTVTLVILIAGLVFLVRTWSEDYTGPTLQETFSSIVSGDHSGGH